MKIEVLHVPDCPNVSVLTDRLDMLVSRRGDVVVEQRMIRDDFEAAVHRMTGSPTLLVDGADPFAKAGHSPNLSCRLYVDEAGRVSGAPSLTQLRTALANGADR